MMRHSFTAWGHINLLATHKNTLEFTKDKELSKTGDCIVGVRANFKATSMKKIVNSCSKIKLTMRVGNHEEVFIADSNKEFSDEHELVLRRSNFLSERTIGNYVNRTSLDIDRKTAKLMQNPKQKIEVTIEPFYKLAIFDFDDTLEDFQICKDYAQEVVAKYLVKEYGLNKEKTLNELEAIDYKYTHKAVAGSPSLFDRSVWFPDLLKRLGIGSSKSEVTNLAKIYWAAAIKRAKPMPGAIPLLKYLKSRMKVAIMSDSDGDKKIKFERLDKTGISKYVHYVLTSNDVGQNKPNNKFYNLLTEKFGVNIEECIMIGDKPEVDLKLAKELGMKTIWVVHGKWAADHKETPHYVDHSVRDMQQLKEFFKKEV